MPIRNAYEEMPKEYLHKPENPNYDLHFFDLPFRMIVNAPSGSGKTNFIHNLLEVFCSRNGRKKGGGTFSTIHIITQNSDEPIYNWIRDRCPQIIIQEGISKLPKLDKETFDKDENHLVICDDLVLEKKQDRIADYYIRCRKLNVSIIYLSQRFYEIPKMIRANCNYFALLKISGMKDFNLICKEFNNNLTPQEMTKVYEYATSTNLTPLVIDLSTRDPAKKYRKGLDEFIDIPRLLQSTNDAKGTR